MAAPARSVGNFADLCYGDSRLKSVGPRDFPHPAEQPMRRANGIKIEEGLKRAGRALGF